MARAWLFGDDIDTDVIAPGKFLMLDPADMASHTLESVRPEFAGAVTPGDVLVAGRNFGLGSSRELAAGAIRELGISVVLARSVARIFYRNALNLGLAVLIWPEDFPVEDGDELRVDPATGTLENLTQGATSRTTPLSGHLLDLVRDGGLIAHLQKQDAS